ncbi:GNAT family N-acetyltransferase [Sulfitobacter albidus]|uniref:GNAT family N-acetyltransferase n=1 Tax=Sulfitobacter albidus TaxID=2829501 RepID=A0A975PP37_9RHOB|nr:GNAT family N-acetyltransferase [Sulfitobacter albidus]
MNRKTKPLKINDTHVRDTPALQTVLDLTALFPSDLLPAMIDGSDALWLTCHAAEPVGFCFAEPEPMTEGTWNMRAIAVLPAHQNSGAGTALTHALETRLRALGARLLIADTSGLPEFAATRAFYRARGYAEQSRIRGFWAPGDDKVTLTKSLDLA